MKFSLHDIELIERYLDNELSAEEKHELQERLKKDFEFQKIVDQEKLLINTIRIHAAKNDLAFLKQVEGSLDDRKAISLKKYWPYYAAAASLILVAILLWSNPFKRDNAQLFAAHFQPHPNIFEPTLRGQADVSQRAQAFHAYEQGAFEQAATLFASLPPEQADAGTQMLLGNSNLAIGKTELATQNFIDLISESDDLDDDAKLYLSLCYLKTGKIASARDLLTEIAAKESAVGKNASDLLKELQ